MRRREFIALAGAAMAFPRVGLAQTAARPLIIVLSNGLPERVRQDILLGLADHGHVDGDNITLEILTAPTIADVPAYAARAVARQPQVIVTQSSAAPLALKDATRTIPVVMQGINDPVAIGAVDSYARPGGNMTGYMSGGPDIAGKQLQIIRDVLPDLSRLALLGLPADAAYPFVLEQVRGAANSLNIETVLFETKEGDPFEPLFDAAIKDRAQGLRIVNANYLQNPPNVNVIADLAIRHKLPAFAANGESARNGLLVGYSAAPYARSAMAYVDAILKGAKPADLPIVQPSLFEVVVNMKTAKALGITIPQAVLFQATEVVA